MKKKSLQPIWEIRYSGNYWNPVKFIPKPRKLQDLQKKTKIMKLRYVFKKDGVFFICGVR